MPITQTTRLLIDHLDPGQSNKDITWNDDLDDFDSVIAGVLSKSMGSATTFTLTTTECQNAVVLCIGSPGGVPTLELSLNKVYIVKNSLTGGHSLTVKGTSAGSTTVLNGHTAIFYVTGNVAVRVVSETGGGGAPYLLNGPNVADYGITGSAVDITAITANLVFRASNTAITPLVAGAASGQSADIFEVKAFGSTNHFLIDSTGKIVLNSKKIEGLANASASTDALPKGQADGLYAPIGSAYLTVGSDATLTNETNISSLASTLTFQASGGGVTPFAIKAGSSPSVDVFQIKDSSNAVTLAVNSSLELDCKTNNIRNVKDPTSSTDGASRNYVDNNAAPTVLQFGNNAGPTDTSTRFFDPGYTLQVPTTNEVKTRINFAGKVSQLRLRARTGPVTQGYNVTVRKNGVDQSITFLVGAGATSQADTTHSFTVVAGDDISVKIVGVSGITGGGADIVVTMELTNT